MKLRNGKRVKKHLVKLGKSVSKELKSKKKKKKRNIRIDLPRLFEGIEDNFHTDPSRAGRKIEEYGRNLFQPKF